MHVSTVGGGPSIDRNCVSVSGKGNLVGDFERG